VRSPLRLASKTREWRHPIDALVLSVRRLLRRRIVRYSLVGGLGIPINIVALAIFLYLMGGRLFPVASALAFEVGMMVKFVLNQLYTYSDQKGLRGWDWLRRAFKAQLAGFSTFALQWAIALGVKLLLDGHGHHGASFSLLAQVAAIGIVFTYSFAVTDRFVFRTATATKAASLPPT